MSNRLSLADAMRDMGSGRSRLDGALATAATRMQDTLSELGGSTAEGLRATRDMAANKLDSAADNLRNTADRVSELGHDTADKVVATANYIRKRKVSAVLSDLERTVRKHPRESLIGAAVGGFLLARLLRVGRRKT
jgi:hypothetical protein